MRFLSDHRTVERLDRVHHHDGLLSNAEVVPSALLRTQRVQSSQGTVAADLALQGTVESSQDRAGVRASPLVDGAPVLSSPPPLPSSSSARSASRSSAFATASRVRLTNVSAGLWYTCASVESLQPRCTSFDRDQASEQHVCRSTCTFQPDRVALRISGV